LPDDADSTDRRPFYEVELRPQGAIVRRTAERYIDLSQLAPSFAALEEQFASLPPGASTLLVDLRKAVGRNDDAFETTLAPMRRELLRRFERSALLVRTTIGRLQLERYLAADAIVARVFSDEAEAMAWFLAQP
jgi:uncharacterized protein (DUF2461 family)